MRWVGSHQPLGGVIMLFELSPSAQDNLRDKLADAFGWEFALDIGSLQDTLQGSVGIVTDVDERDYLWCDYIEPDWQDLDTLVRVLTIINELVA